MISNDRPRERGRFLRDAPARDVRALQYLYATFRQGLLEFLGRRPPGVVLMPDYVPEGVYDPFKRRGFEIVFYPMGPDLRLSRDVLDRALAGGPIGSSASTPSEPTSRRTSRLSARWRRAAPSCSRTSPTPSPIRVSP
jgi:hypothetical protein